MGRMNLAWSKICHASQNIAEKKDLPENNRIIIPLNESNIPINADIRKVRFDVRIKPAYRSDNSMLTNLGRKSGDG